MVTIPFKSPPCGFACMIARLTLFKGAIKGPAKGLLWLSVVVACGAVIPAAALLGILILGIEPNPRHPPADIMGEAVGWAMIGAFSGAVSAIIGEALVMREEGGFFVSNRGLILGSLVGITIGAFLGINLAILQMDSVDGQAITSINLGVLAGATVSILGALAGCVIGAVLGRVVGALSS